MVSVCLPLTQFMQQTLFSMSRNRSSFMDFKIYIYTIDIEFNVLCIQLCIYERSTEMMLKLNMQLYIFIFFQFTSSKFKLCFLPKFWEITPNLPWPHRVLSGFHFSLNLFRVYLKLLACVNLLSVFHSFFLCFTLNLVLNMC